MKKIFSLLIAFVAFLSSCTNDDIGSSYTKDEHFYETFTYNVNTQPVFDEFNATSSIKEQILGGSDGDLYIGVYTYIYDKNGDLKNKNISYSKTFGSESCDFTLEDGNYTAVSVEMVVDKDDNYQSPRFEIKGEDKLSKLEVAYRTYINDKGETKPYTTSVWYQCVGVSTQTINVERTMQAVTVNPNAIGVVVNCEFYNFDKSSYGYLSLFTKNAPIGRFLDPAKTGDERFKYENYNEKNKVTGRYTLRAQFTELVEMDVYLLEEGNDIDCELGAGNINSEGNISFSWWTDGWNKFEDGKTYYAGAYYIGGTQGPDCNGGIFDNTTDYLSWFNNAKTMSVSLSALTEPYTTWSSSVSTVQSNMTGYTLTVGSSGKAEVTSNGSSYYIEYSANSPIAAIQYFFNTQTAGLFESDVFYYKSSASENRMLELLNSKYTYQLDQDGTYVYKTKDDKSYVIFMENGDYWQVGYVDPSVLSSSSAPAFINQKSKMKEQNNILMPLFVKKDMVMSPVAISNNLVDRRSCRIK